ncbi:hypothetical protein HRbin11_02198 [bacterium HR11]|nr:hypothetical protein HRbin11_02198 [bacterium HR11]
MTVETWVSLVALVLVVLSYTVVRTPAGDLALLLTALVLNSWTGWRVGRVWWSRRTRRRLLRQLARSRDPVLTGRRPACQRLRRDLRRLHEAARASRSEVVETLRAIVYEQAEPRRAMMGAVQYRPDEGSPRTSWAFLRDR